MCFRAGVLQVLAANIDRLAPRGGRREPEPFDRAGEGDKSTYLTPPSWVSSATGKECSPMSEENQTPKELREAFDRLKADNEKLKADQESAAADKRKLLKYEAGLADLDDEKFAALGEGDAEALKAKADSWGWLAKPEAEPVEPDDGPTPQEAAAAAASKALRSGGTPPGEEPPSADPTDVSSYQKARENGVRAEEAQRQHIQGLINAAHAGDARAIYDPTRDRGQG